MRISDSGRLAQVAMLGLFVDGRDERLRRAGERRRMLHQPLPQPPSRQSLPAAVSGAWNRRSTSWPG
jgi:hypothetical protein